jgi:glycosyltransferase involved in cell wall biosynthesis
LERWFYSPSLVAALRDELESGHFDLVHLDELCLARALDRRVSTPVVVHHHKLDTLLHELLPQRNPLGKAFDLFKLRRLEAAAAKRYRFHVLTSAEDQAALRALHPALETSVVESGFDPEYFRPRQVQREREQLLFLGSLDYAPNIDGLQWFVREVLPLILAIRPSVRLSVVGSAPPQDVLALNSATVQVLGRVSDVRPHLCSAAGMVVPLRIGGGTRIKIVEALGCELPVISTAVGAQGLEFSDPEQLWIADDAAEFAAKTLELLGDPEQASERARRGRELALRRYTWQDLAGRLLEAWKRAAGRV